LSVYLLFLNSVFIASTDSRGAHTVSLKPLEAIDRLPSAFFDLLSLQGWAKIPQEKALNEEQALNAWLRRNLASEAQQAAVQQVQRQVFQLTHDVRSVFLFRSEDGKDSRGRDLLEIVKSSTTQLSKVAKPDVQAGPAPKPALKLPAPEQALAVTEPARARRGHSVPAVRQRALPPSPSAAQEAPLPVGRTYATLAVRHQGRGLALAGQAALASAQPGRAKPGGHGPTFAGASFEGSSMQYASVSEAANDSQMTPVVETQLREAQVDASASDHQKATGSEAVVEDAQDTEVTQGVAFSAAEVQDEEEEQLKDLEHAASFLDGVTFPAYSMPKRPPEIYQKQVETLLSMKPTSLVYEVNKYQAANPMLGEPFERVLRKLPEHVRPLPDELPAGPMAHPSEPVWFEMQHRLEVILRKQGRRAERKRKRRIRNKIFHGRPPRPAKKTEGRELREYLDRASAAQGSQDVPGEASGEFLGKVHERYLQKCEQIEQDRFQVRGTGNHPVGRSIGGESLLRAPKVVRPIYVPPPGAGMVGP